MDVKLRLTKHFADAEGLPASTSLEIDALSRHWWMNRRNNGERSYALTTNGYTVLSKHLKFYRIDFLDTMRYTNNTVIWLDKFIDCPYYIDKHSIYVSREKVAVQLILFSGDLNRFGKAKDRSSKRSLT